MSIPHNPLAEQVQRRLKARGHDLGTSGPLGDGVDGRAGNLTFAAVLAEIPDIAPVPVPLKPAETALSFAQRQIDLDLLCIAFPANTRAGLEPWVEPTRQACVRWGIDTFREVASFLANINVESAGLTRLSESLNYSVDALIAKFGRHRISVADANRYGRGNGHAADQEALANILYGGPWGAKNLGNTQPGDGWRFRGYGPKQLTGRANQTAFANAIGKPVDEIPAYVRTPEGGMMSAGWFWKSHDLDAKAATPGVEDDRRAINGGTFGLADVERIFDDLIEELLRREKAAA
ncbi:endolysin [Erythrobacter phage vB_EliS_R6L]|nr:endolysin [Erythrobacter phage vB_EliS_R6L]